MLQLPAAFILSPFRCIFSLQGLSDMDVSSFCARCVDPMGEESDHIQLVALTDALQVGWALVLVCTARQAPQPLASALFPEPRSPCPALRLAAAGLPRLPLSCRQAPVRVVFRPACEVLLMLHCSCPLAQVPVRVVYLDRSLAPGGGDSGDGNGEVQLTGLAWHDVNPGRRP